MSRLSEAQTARREKTLTTALLMSAWGPLVTGIAVISSQSTTQVADFIRRTAELIAMFVSWWVFRHLQRNSSLGEAEKSRLERISSLSVGGAMICSGMVMLILALSRLSAPMNLAGNVTLGLTIAMLGLLTNSWFWRRYSMLNREHYSPIIEAQSQLYRAKASVDLCVAVALAAVAIAPTHPATQYIDLLGSIIVAGYLLWSGARTWQPHMMHVQWLYSLLRKQP